MRRAAVAWGAGMALFTGSAAAAPHWLPAQRLFAEAQALYPSAVMAPDGTITADVSPDRVETRPPGGAFGPAWGPGDLPYDVPKSGALVQGHDGGVAFLYQTTYDSWASTRPASMTPETCWRCTSRRARTTST